MSNQSSTFVVPLKSFVDLYLLDDDVSSLFAIKQEVESLLYSIPYVILVTLMVGTLRRPRIIITVEKYVPENSIDSIVLLLQAKSELGVDCVKEHFILEQKSYEEVFPPVDTGCSSIVNNSRQRS
ncbi:MAG: hypothetical protein Sylvanvirus6_41 [Sylvanvirus sp.]|uniref:Uncharacterized protein n=1 Tax=Sylvanvirus sp. TaxID=2487774 RepID=A0A3G5AHQ6_9VIRU|nr:MAG: hypothetical protein Sylvanvirus6_41 [Sylvanvirus sp.]